MTCPFCGARDAAKPLEWVSNHGQSVVEITADGIASKYTITSSRMKYQIDLWVGCRKLAFNFDDIYAAKAHAEELHQQAWRGLRERWDAA